jgi:hypothetical protein
MSVSVQPILEGISVVEFAREIKRTLGIVDRLRVCFSRTVEVINSSSVCFIHIYNPLNLTKCFKFVHGN